MSAAVKERAVRRRERVSQKLAVNGTFRQRRRSVTVGGVARGRAAQVERLTLAGLRSALGWSRNQLARVMNASDRAIVNWEGGEPMSAVYASKLREIQSVFNELKRLMKVEEIGPWLLMEMDEFEGRTPAELIGRGETGRLWASLFYLRSGMPD
jgi:transcriptional regulator with XRE-family HTH domain